MSRQLFEYHPSIGYLFVPNLKARLQHESGGYLLRTNNWGFRSEIDYHKSKSDRDITRYLMFGDSFTAGDGVSNKKRFSDLIMTRMDNLEVYNFGIPGTGTDQQYLAYKEFSTDLENDHIFICVLVENIRRVNSKFRLYNDEKGNAVYYQKPFYVFQDGQLTLTQVPVLKEPLKASELGSNLSDDVDTGGKFPMLRRIINKIGLKDLVQRIVRYQPLPEYNKPLSKEWLLLKSILKEWVAQIPKGKVTLITLPLYQHIEGTASSVAYTKRFSEFSAETGVRIIDPLPKLKRASKKIRRSYRFENDVHLTPDGHKAVADIVIEEIVNAKI